MSSAPFKSTDIYKREEWDKKDCHPCSIYAEKNPPIKKQKYIRIYSSKPKLKQKKYGYYEETYKRKTIGKNIWKIILIILFLMIILYYLAVNFNDLDLFLLEDLSTNTCSPDFLIGISVSL